MIFDVFTALAVSFTSVVWRIASMGDTLDALTAGRYAETKIVSIETRQVIKSNNGVTISLSFSLVHNAPSIIVFMNEKVIPIPARPHKMPMGMLIKPMTIPSKIRNFASAFSSPPRSRASLNGGNVPRRISQKRYR